MAGGVKPLRTSVQNPLHDLLVQLQVELEASRHEYLNSAQSLDAWVVTACNNPADQVHLLPHPVHAGSTSVRKADLDTSLRRFAQVVVSATAPTQGLVSAKLPEAGVLGGEAFPPPPAVVSSKPPARPVLADKAPSALASPIVSAISSMQLPRGTSTPRSVAASSLAHFDSPLRSPSEATASAPVFTFTSDHTQKSPARGVEPTFGGVRDIARSWPLRVVSPTKLPAKIVGPVTGGEPSSARGSTPLSKTMDPVPAGETFLAVLESPKPLLRTTEPVLGGETFPTEAVKPLPKAMARVQSGDAFPAVLESAKPSPRMAPVHSGETFPTEAARPLLPKAMARVHSGDAFPAVLESAKPSPRMAPVHSGETFPAALEAAKPLAKTMARVHSGDAFPAMLESAKPLPKIMAPVRSGEASPAQACRIAPMGVSTKLPAKTIEPVLGAEASFTMGSTVAPVVVPAMPLLKTMEPVPAGDALPAALEPAKPLAMTMTRAHSGESFTEVLPKPVPQTTEPVPGGEPFPALLAKLKTVEPVLGEEGPLVLESVEPSPKRAVPTTMAPNVEAPTVVSASVVPAASPLAAWAPEVGENGRLSGSSGERDDTFPAPPPDEPWMQLRRKALPTKSPEDNYELSDGGGDSEAEEPRERGRKFVPAWCKTYLEDLQRQVDVDPDSIFGNRVPQCCLEDIFTDATYKQAGKSRPRRRRGSSGNWSRDPLTYKEVTSYKERIGHHRGWEEARMCAA